MGVKHGQAVRGALAAFILVFIIALTGCGGVKGTYSDPNAAVVLELRSGGDAAITFMGETVACTYSTSGKQVLLDCKPPAGKMTFTIHDDQSLTGPPGGFMPTLRKQK